MSPPSETMMMAIGKTGINVKIVIEKEIAMSMMMVAAESIGTVMGIAIIE